MGVAQCLCLIAKKTPHGCETFSAYSDRCRPSCSSSSAVSPCAKNAPTITRGPYAGEIVTGDHIIPRSVCPELDNKIYDLEMMPLTLNQRKSAKIGTRQIDLAKRWNTDGLLSDAGLEAVLREGRSE